MFMKNTELKVIDFCVISTDVAADTQIELCVVAWRRVYTPRGARVCKRVCAYVYVHVCA